MTRATHPVRRLCPYAPTFSGMLVIGLLAAGTALAVVEPEFNPQVLEAKLSSLMDSVAVVMDSAGHNSATLENPELTAAKQQLTTVRQRMEVLERSRPTDTVWKDGNQIPRRDEQLETRILGEAANVGRAQRTVFELSQGEAAKSAYQEYYMRQNVDELRNNQTFNESAVPRAAKLMVLFERVWSARFSMLGGATPEETRTAFEDQKTILRQFFSWLEAFPRVARSKKLALQDDLDSLFRLRKASATRTGAGYTAQAHAEGLAEAHALEEQGIAARDAIRGEGGDPGEIMPRPMLLGLETQARGSQDIDVLRSDATHSRAAAGGALGWTNLIDGLKPSVGIVTADEQAAIGEVRAIVADHVLAWTLGEAPRTLRAARYMRGVPGVAKTPFPGYLGLGDMNVH